jgi:hypothetical protein
MTERISARAHPVENAACCQLPSAATPDGNAPKPSSLSSSVGVEALAPLEPLQASARTVTRYRIELLAGTIYLSADADGAYVKWAEVAPLLTALAEMEAWKRDSDILRRCGIIEIAVANNTGSVSEYMEHWEGRALKAEAALEEARRLCAQLRAALERTS